MIMSQKAKVHSTTLCHAKPVLKSMGSRKIPESLPFFKKMFWILYYAKSVLTLKGSRKIPESLRLI